MGRPPCCDKVGVKKGPWTPEEDIILVTYIQDHGPGNWRSVPTNTGLLRCSKSCRLRWTNYLRPGIKRGNFTPHEEGMIIHLQSLFGNKWAAIASYLPQRTDNDIKNYWNTHLKKKIKKFQTATDSHRAADSSTFELISKSNSEKRSSDILHHASILSSNQTSTYASSTENISRLLEGWMRSPKSTTTLRKDQHKEKQSGSQDNENKSNSDAVETTSLQCNQPKIEQETCDLISNEDFESLLSFENLNGIAWEKSSSDSTFHGSQTTTTCERLNPMFESKQKFENPPPLSLIENWFLEEATEPVQQDMLELS